MQTEKRPGKSPCCDHENSGIGKSAHFICISSESGIIQAFEQIKSRLGGELNSCLTLLYSIPADLSLPLFKAELDSLEKRFPSRLITYYLFSHPHHPFENSGRHQQVLEIVINSNTCTRMQFQVLGQEDFVGMVVERLHFLGIKTYQIKSQIIY